MLVEITVTNDELMTVREAMRTLNQRIAELESGKNSKLVLTRHNRMIAVVISAERYSEMMRSQKGGTR